MGSLFECPHCRRQVDVAEEYLGQTMVCPYCQGEFGTPEPAPPPPPRATPFPPVPSRKRMEPHRGGAVLALGILGLAFCVICGIIAWAMGNDDLAKMRAGRMDPSGKGLTEAGRICGMISVIWVCVVIGLYLFFAVGFGSLACVM